MLSEIKSPFHMRDRPMLFPLNMVQQKADHCQTDEGVQFNVVYAAPEQLDYEFLVG